MGMMVMMVMMAVPGITRKEGKWQEMAESYLGFLATAYCFPTYLVPTGAHHTQCLLLNNIVPINDGPSYQFASLPSQ